MGIKEVLQRNYAIKSEIKKKIDNDEMEINGLYARPAAAM
jgi:hypothetical protein